METAVLKSTSLVRRVKVLFKPNRPLQATSLRASTPAPDIVGEVENMVYENTYHYKPIHTGATIRILALNPGTGDDPLTGRLAHVDLDSSPALKVLSYVWGDSPKRKTFACDSKSVFLTVSLYDALRRVSIAR
jgi:hypothetical protein